MSKFAEFVCEVINIAFDTESEESSNEESVIYTFLFADNDTISKEQVHRMFQALFSDYSSYKEVIFDDVISVVFSTENDFINDCTKFSNSVKDFNEVELTLYQFIMLLSALVKCIDDDAIVDTIQRVIDAYKVYLKEHFNVIL